MASAPILLVQTHVTATEVWSELLSRGDEVFVHRMDSMGGLSSQAPVTTTFQIGRDDLDHPTIFFTVETNFAACPATSDSDLTVRSEFRLQIDRTRSDRETVRTTVHTSSPKGKGKGKGKGEDSEAEASSASVPM